MEWIAELVENYLTDPDKLLKSRWLTFPSWISRFRLKTRYKEINRLLTQEAEFNKKWIDEVSKLSLSEDEINEGLLHIETHVNKHKERSFFLVVLTALFAVSLKLLGLGLIPILSLIVAIAFLVAGERLFSSTISIALEELKTLIEHSLK